MLAVLGLTVGNLLHVETNMTAGNGWDALAQVGARPFWGICGVAAAALAAAVTVPGARALLHFGVPTNQDLALAIATVTLSVVLGAAISRRLRPAVINPL